MKKISIIILLAVLIFSIFNFFNSTKSKNNNINTNSNNISLNQTTNTINTSSIITISSNYTTESNNINIIDDFQNIISEPKNLVHKFFLITYNYNTEKNNYYDGTQELMTSDCFNKFKPPISPNERISDVKIIPMEYKLQDFNIYENYFSENSIELIGIVDYKVAIGNQVTKNRDFIKFQVSKETTWLISNIEMLGTITL